MSVPREELLRSSKAGGMVIRGSVWRLGGNVAGMAAGIATATLLLRHLGVVQSGRYVTVLSLAAIAATVADVGLNVSASRELALCQGQRRTTLMANVLGQRIWLTPIASLAIVGFALLAGYPQSTQIGALLASAGVYVMAIADGLLLPLTVELQNAGLAFVDFLKQAVTLACVAGLIALGAALTPFFAVLAIAGLGVVASASALLGRRAFVRPRFDHDAQRSLLLGALPLAAALVLGQLYFRLVILAMSLASNPRQTGYFAGSLRAIEALVAIPILLAGVALPLLAASARDDRDRFRHVVQGLSKGALIAGVLVVLVAFRAAQPVMRAIGGHGFEASGAVLRIQVGALLFGALVQIWAVALVALGRQRELIVTNALGLLGITLFAALLIGPFGAQGGAVAAVAGDALLALLTWWRLRACGVPIRFEAGFLARLALAGAVSALALTLPHLPELATAALAAVVFLGVGQLVGIIPDELHEAIGSRRLLRLRASSRDV